MNCPNCSSSLPAGALFCMYCGQPVAVPSPADSARLARLAASVPAPLAEKMQAARLSGERKVVTALFADVVGSTAMAEQMDAEDWTEMMNGAFDRISPIIYHYEGTIARLLGDAMLAFFGAPLAHEDDPARAVRAALDILEAIRAYALLVKDKYGMDFAIRIGINTGPVIVGEVGSELKYEYTAMGDAINLAARLQSAARPMSTLISQNTHRFVASQFEFADLGQIEVKGKAEPVQLYAVIGIKHDPGKMRGLAGLTSPMVGRDAEFSTLLKLSTALSAGHGGAAVIIGEAGLGKSRLLSEWKKTVTGPETVSIKWADGRCLSYGQRLAYHLLIDLIRSLLGARPGAADSEVQSALHGLLNALFGDEAPEVYPYLAHMLSIELEGEALKQVQAMDPQTLQSRYRETLARLLESLSARQPLVLVLDDIHWADPASVELLIHLLPLTAKSAVLFCMLTRPDEEAPGWRLVGEARKSTPLAELALSPLTSADSRQLVSNLLEIEALPESVRDVILKKAEGNPFFVEEVIRMLIDTNGIIAKDGHWEAGKAIESVEIPNNLQSLLLARIDRLPEESKRTLRVAAVIGRQFSVNVLEQVMRRLDE
jgi:class 3 adenylate cyclase